MMPGKPRVFVDADVLFAGSASPSEHSASLVILRMAEITLIDAVASQQVITEAERNLGDYLPTALPLFRTLVGRCLRIVENPTTDQVAELGSIADSKDLPILGAALRAQCTWLVTFNTRHFQPGYPSVIVLRPGKFVQRIRGLLASLSSE